MKITFLSLAFLFATCVSSFGQKIGIKAGGNYAGVMAKDGSGNSVKGLSFIPGFHVGAFGEIDLGSAASVQIEACFSQKGYRDKSSTTMTAGFNTVTSTANVLYKYNYIDIPLILNIHFGSYGGYIGLGPQVSLLMSAKYDGTITNTTSNPSTTPPTNSTSEVTWAGDNKANTSKTDFGILFGMGSKWESGIEYCLRAGMGLSNMIDQSASTNKGVLHNLVFQVSIGYAFGVGSGGGGDRYGHKYNKPKRR